MNHSPNRLLSSLGTEIYEALQPNLSLIEYRRGDILAETGQPIDRAHFPHCGIISLVVQLSSGDMIESAMVGRDGVVHASSALDGKVALNKAVVQLAGHGSAIAVKHLVEAVDAFRELRARLLRHEQVLFAQAQQSVACNVSHVVEARLCRWLLRCRDLAGTNDLTVTQEFLAQMLGVGRSSLSITAHTLQNAGLIHYKRGRVHIADVEGLREGACECYETVRQHYEQLLSPRLNTEAVHA